MRATEGQGQPNNPETLVRGVEEEQLMARQVEEVEKETHMSQHGTEMMFQLVSETGKRRRSDNIMSSDVISRSFTLKTPFIVCHYNRKTANSICTTGVILTRIHTGCMTTSLEYINMYYNVYTTCLLYQDLYYTCFT